MSEQRQNGNGRPGQFEKEIISALEVFAHLMSGKLEDAAVYYIADRFGEISKRMNSQQPATPCD